MPGPPWESPDLISQTSDLCEAGPWRKASSTQGVAVRDSHRLESGDRETLKLATPGAGGFTNVSRLRSLRGL